MTFASIHEKLALSLPLPKMNSNKKKSCKLGRLRESMVPSTALDFKPEKLTWRSDHVETNKWSTGRSGKCLFGACHSKPTRRASGLLLPLYCHQQGFHPPSTGKTPAWFLPAEKMSKFILGRNAFRAPQCGKRDQYFHFTLFGV